MEDLLNQLESYKNGRINASQLETDLEQTIKTTLSDHTFRLQLGSNEIYWKLFNAVLATLNQDTNEACQINLIKLTRNVVAGNLHNQQLAIQHGALYKIEDLLYEKKTSTRDNNMILQVGTQAICNIITNNPTAIDFIWKIWMTNEERGSIWSYILSKSNQDLLMCALILIINCIRGSKARCELLVTKTMGQSILAAILGDVERLHGNQESKNFELGYTIFSELISCHYFDLLYTQVDDYSDKNLLSDHQIILLKFLDSKINTIVKAGTFPEFIKDKELKLLVEQLSVVGKATVDVIESIKEKGSSSLQEEQLTNIYTGIILLLQIVNELFILNQDGKIKQLLLEYNILPIVIDILGHLEVIQLPPSNENNPEIGFHFLKRECIRVLGTMCYKDTSVQDKIRELGGIPLILAQLKIDDSNPYIREYALLALRNVLENNFENQKIIQELEAEKVVETEELTQMGYRPELLENGKVRLKKL